ncbi:MAG: prepilin-type N-terminal cleavage/methylation domain-containing protein [Clostridiales bacterium]|nr:prepilin-type N-terminal cleavage/methylation domain-containing protein [Clostridiales bacterium]
MIRINGRSTRFGKRAFTLTEILVVLVVLALIAAVLVPSLTGYIKRAKRDRYVNNVNTALVASQAIMNELYGLGPGAQTIEANGAAGGGSGGDVRWDTGLRNNSAENIAWGDKILELMGRDRDTAPYLFIFGVGRSDCGLDPHAPYTVYYVAYVEDENSPAVFYVNGTWMYTYPRDDASVMKQKSFPGGVTCRNTIVLDGANIPLQLYVVSQRTGIADNFWTSSDSRSLRSHSEPHYNM